MRRAVVLALTMLAGLVLAGGNGSALASGGTAASAKKPKAVKPVVRVLNLNASQLARGKAKVQVRASKGAKVRVAATTYTFDSGNRQLFKARTVKLGRKSSRTVSIGILPSVRSGIDTCQLRTITVKGKNGKRRSTRKQTVFRDQAECQLTPVDLSRADDCDFIAQPKDGMCMLPFPSDFYTVNDPDTPTGKRVNFTEGSMPRNKEGVPINHNKLNVSDGFSQGQGAIVRIPGLDSLAAVQANDLVPLNHLGDYAQPDQKLVVINTKTGKRHPVWAEIDSNAGLDRDRVLEIKPSENYEEKTRYIVALRNLTDKDGNPLAAP
ncbi:MAG: hypothetical protein KDB57_12495, partial [Solirubrobacterales bacterium]|nr:hypothetical protein [Solirubrobacterales bacterium]